MLSFFHILNCMRLNGDITALAASRSIRSLFNVAHFWPLSMLRSLVTCYVAILQ